VRTAETRFRQTGASRRPVVVYKYNPVEIAVRVYFSRTSEAWSGPCCCAFRSVPSPRRGLLGIFRPSGTFVQQRAQLAGSRIRQVPELRRPYGRFRLAHSSRGPRNRRMVARPPWPTAHYLSMAALAPAVSWHLYAVAHRRHRPPSLPEASSMSGGEEVVNEHGLVGI
jgi:hypothetical protein